MRHSSSFVYFDSFTTARQIPPIGAGTFSLFATRPDQLSIMKTTWKAPVGPWAASDQTSFAYESTAKRWPVILTGIINAVVTVNEELDTASQSSKLTEGKQIIAAISGLKYEIAHDRLLQCGINLDTSRKVHV